jgi:hypothetical protein
LSYCRIHRSSPGTAHRGGRGTTAYFFFDSLCSVCFLRRGEYFISSSL